MKGMFTYIKETNIYWFTTSLTKGMLAEYNLIGMVKQLTLYFKLKFTTNLRFTI
jgi:hypothetical protein